LCGTVRELVRKSRSQCGLSMCFEVQFCASMLRYEENLCLFVCRSMLRDEENLCLFVCRNTLRYEENLCLFVYRKMLRYEENLCLFVSCMSWSRAVRQHVSLHHLGSVSGLSAFDERKTDDIRVAVGGAKENHIHTLRGAVFQGSNKKDRLKRVRQSGQNVCNPLKKN